MNDLQDRRALHGIGSPPAFIAHAAPASARWGPSFSFMSSSEPNAVSSSASSAPLSSIIAGASPAGGSLGHQHQVLHQEEVARHGGRKGSRGSSVSRGSDNGSNTEAPVPDAENRPPTAEEVRAVVRLMQCSICSCLLHEPMTLPCGRNLCKKCLPEPHLRQHISYPATPSRRMAFDCPFSDCQKEHAVGDCSVDVTLNKAMTDVHVELGKGRDAAIASELSTCLVPREGWEATGAPSLRGTGSNSRMLAGGKLLALCELAARGELDYNAEASFESTATEQHEESDFEVLKRVKEVVRAEVDCQVCYALYCDPVTTPCGHTFCRPCLQRVLDHARYCPVCRRVLTIQPMLNPVASPPNRLLTDIITAFWSDLLTARRQVMAAEALHDGTTEYDISVFVCTLSFPLMPTFLHVFEPRYRLMIRRALEGDRMFGMVYYQNNSFTELGTVLRIVNAEFFPDGRSLIETVGVSRFRILHSGVLDGYMVARIQRVNDLSIAEEEELEAAETRRGNSAPSTTAASTAAAAAQPTASTSTSTSPSTLASQTSEGHSASSPIHPMYPESRFPATLAEIETSRTADLMDFVVDFVRQMQDESVRWLAARVLAVYGECPRDPAIFPWWFASVLPVSPEEKYRLLGTQSVRERLKICCGWILAWERSRWMDPTVGLY